MGGFSVGLRPPALTNLFGLLNKLAIYRGGGGGGGFVKKGRKRYERMGEVGKNKREKYLTPEYKPPTKSLRDMYLNRVAMVP